MARALLVAMSRSRLGHAPRLAGWDYTSAGAYAVTIVVARRRRVLATLCADVPTGTTHTAIGAIVWDCWHRLPERFAGVRLDAAVLMPDHLHAILWLGALRPTRRARQGPTRRTSRRWR